MTISTPGSGPVAVEGSPHARLRPLALDRAAIVGGLWAEHKRVNRDVLLPGAVGHLETAGNLNNLRAAAGRSAKPFRGMVFADSDVYKGRGRPPLRRGVRRCLRAATRSLLRGDVRCKSVSTHPPV